jgi:hypothetical protein
MLKKSHTQIFGQKNESSMNLTTEREVVKTCLLYYWKYNFADFLLNYAVMSIIILYGW